MLDKNKVQGGNVEGRNIIRKADKSQGTREGQGKTRTGGGGGGGGGGGRPLKKKKRRKKKISFDKKP